MWQTGQPDAPCSPDQIDSPCFVLTEQYPAFEGPWHAHRQAQLIYAVDGLLSIRTRSGLWVVPPGRAVWLPPGELHQGLAARPFRLKTLYLSSASITCLPVETSVVAVDPLLDALLTEAAGFGAGYAENGPEARLFQVVLDRLAMLKPVGTFLPAVSDKRLLTLTRLLESAPSDQRPLAELAPLSGMTARTASRLFRQETGLTFGEWRQQLRLLTALQALSQGERVTNVAAEVGYGDVSAFIQVFKSAFGESPGRYMRRLGTAAETRQYARLEPR